MNVTFEGASNADDSSAMLILVVDLLDGLLDEIIEGDIVLPTPVLIGSAVVN